MKSSVILQKGKKDITRLPSIIILVTVAVVGYFYSQRDTTYIEKNGVWTIMTVTGKLINAHGGWSYEAYYSLNGVKYVDSKTYGSACEASFAKSEPRYFILCLPSDPLKKADYSAAPVPLWFTLDAPSEGWNEMPTVSQMRLMMANTNNTNQ